MTAEQEIFYTVVANAKEAERILHQGFPTAASVRLVKERPIVLKIAVPPGVVNDEKHGVPPGHEKVWDETV